MTSIELTLVDNELTCLMRSVNRVGRVIERVYGADALTIACQVCDSRQRLWAGHLTQYIDSGKDGKAAGQSVPHVHFHLMPRKAVGDVFADRNDEIYPELEKNEGSLQSRMSKLSSKAVHNSLRVAADEDRKPRTLEEMEEEDNDL